MKRYAFAVAVALLASTAHAQDREACPTIAPPAPYIPPAAKPHVNALGPVEYDKPYQGKLKMIRGDKFTMSVLCPRVANQPVTLGCSWAALDRSECVVVMAEDGIIYDAGWLPIIIWRHERSHCNGWGLDHAGARPVTPETLGQQQH